MQRVLVVRPELHEPHVRALRQLGDAFDAWEEPGREKKSAIPEEFQCECSTRNISMNSNFYFNYMVILNFLALL